MGINDEKRGFAGPDRCEFYALVAWLGDPGDFVEGIVESGSVYEAGVFEALLTLRDGEEQQRLQTSSPTVLAFLMTQSVDVGDRVRITRLEDWRTWPRFVGEVLERRPRSLWSS